MRQLADWIRTDQVRKRQPDRMRVASMIEASKINARVALSVPLTEDSATLVFREIYESIRQLGDATLWQLGYEPRNHEVSMDALKGLELHDPVPLNNLSRFKRIRNDANYRGMKVSTSQANEIMQFWQSHGDEIIRQLRRMNKK
jgi:hypothetical protein